MRKEIIRQEAIKYLNQSMQEEDYIDSAVFTMFDESLNRVTTKTELMKDFVKTCNEEMEKSFLRRNAIYLEIKDFIKLYNPRYITVETEEKQIILVADFEPTMYHIYDVKTHGKYPVRLIDGGCYLTEYTGDNVDECNDMGWFNLNTKEYNLFKSNLKEMELKWYRN